MTATTLDKVQVDGLTIAYRELGSGPPVLLLHGWPTSSFLWRDVMSRLRSTTAWWRSTYRASVRPTSRWASDTTSTCSSRTLDGFLAALGIEEVGLAVHDLGGPVGVHWALHHPERVTKLALLNTLVYPEFSEAVLQFITACSTPELREQLTSPAGLEAAMRLGLADEGHLTDEVLAAVREPFQTADSRRALADAGIGLQPEGFVEIARLLPSLRIPVRVIYGAQDQILPDIADTMARVKNGPAAGRGHGAARLRSLPAGGGWRRDRRAARALLRRRLSAQAASPARSAAVTSSIAARDARPTLTVLQKPCTRPAWRRTVTGTPASRNRAAYSSPSSRNTSNPATATCAGGRPPRSSASRGDTRGSSAASGAGR